MNNVRQEIGAIWRKEKNGNVFYSGEIILDGVKTFIVMFPNDKKTPGSKAPDWRILISNRANEQSSPAKPEPVKREAVKPVQKNSNSESPTAEKTL